MSRLKSIMKNIILQPQSAFVKGRQILDSVFIANECIEDRRLAGKNGVLCKLDLEKAYDCMNWNFLDYILLIMGFWVKWRSQISYCIRSVSFSVLVNGSPARFFGNSRGLHQGDPLSLLLFIMVTEVLSKMIEKMEMSYISGFKVGQEEVTVSHLQFADDTMIFYDADICQIRYLRCILRCFEMVSGLKINLAKSGMFQIREVREIEDLTWVLGYKIGTLPSSYMGIPLGANFKSKVVQNKTIERIASKLESWKVPLLSKGGRMTLIKSNLISLPIISCLS